MGFLVALLYALKFEKGGLEHWGTVCSSWVWMCRSVSRRTAWNPLGDQSRDFVMAGNIMVSRMCLILLVSCVRNVMYILEQPASSLMIMHPRLVYIVDIFGGYTVNTYMGAFGAPTLKPTKLLSNQKWVAELKRTADKELRHVCKGDTVRHSLNSKSQRQVTGNLLALKEHICTRVSANFFMLTVNDTTQTKKEKLSKQKREKTGDANLSVGVCEVRVQGALAKHSQH